MITITTIFVGIDVGKKSNHICILSDNGKAFQSSFPKTTLNGAEKIAAKLKTILLNTDFSKVIIGMESTSVYADHLATFLRNNDFLKTWRCEVFVLNAKNVRKFKDSYPELLKTDDIDAFIIADYLRGRISKIVRPDDNTLLCAISRGRGFRRHNLSCEKNRFLEALFYKFSSLDSSKVFSDTFGTMSLAVIISFFPLTTSFTHRWKNWLILSTKAEKVTLLTPKTLQKSASRRQKLVSSFKNSH